MPRRRVGVGFGRWRQSFLNRDASVNVPVTELEINSYIATIDGAQSSSVEPVFLSTFESGTKVPDFGGTWQTGAGEVTESAARTGTYGLDMSWNGPSNEQRGTLSGQYPRLWVERWIYIDPNHFHPYPYLPNNNKFFSMWGRDYGTENRAKIVIELRPLDQSGDPLFRFMANPNGGPTAYDVGSPEVGGTVTSVSGIADSGDVLIRGQWNRFRYHVDIGTGPGEGIIRAWVGDVLIFDQPGLNIYPTTGSYEHTPYFDAFYLWGAANMPYPEDTIFYEDDIAFYASDPGW